MGHLRRLSRRSALCLLLLLATGALSAQTQFIGGIMPDVDPQFFDSNGNPLAGGSLTFYFAGTLVPQPIYAEATLTTPLSNPVSLNSTGRAPSIFFNVSSYKVVLKDVDGITIRSVDGVSDVSFLAKLAVAPSVQTMTDTGTVNDFGLIGAPTFGGNYSTLYLRCNNASTLFITGLTAAAGGQRLVITSVGTGDVFLSNQDTQSSAQDRMINLVTVSSTVLLHGTGTAEFVYDSVTQRWRMVSYNMGGYATYLPAWTMTCTSGSCTNPVIGNGTLSGRYTQIGRQVFIDYDILAGSTTTFGTGTGFWTLSLPVAAVDTSGQVGGTALILDSGTRYWHAVPMMVTTSSIDITMIDNSFTLVKATVPQTWATNDRLSLSMWYFIQ